jgi:hypothetical protein
LDRECHSPDERPARKGTLARKNSRSFSSSSDQVRPVTSVKVVYEAERVILA